jgi:hypothetical protein
MKRLITLLLTFVAVWSASANPIDKQQARQLAEKFLQGKGTVISNEAAARSIRRNLNTANQPFYVFNTTRNRGFVIVAGDDSMEPIIGYTTQGSFDEDDLPENFKAWLEQTAAEIEAAGKQPAQTRGTSGPKPVARTVAIHQEVKPLIITTWDQGNYNNSINSDGVYNSHLPMIGSKYPCTGCVATAGAQVMNYYKWPVAPTQAVPGYGSAANTTEDLPPITFQWDKMKTSYSYNDPDADAVADLMLYCGYAAQMNYGVNGSSASTKILAEGMCKYFDYNPNAWKMVFRSDYSISEWDEIVYNELASGRPIIYSGSFNGGHAFICDGYDGEGLFHFNWGWGGGYNGYFKLQATNPKGEADISDMGYISNNYCIIGLQPNSWPDIIDPNGNDTWETPVIEGIVATASRVRVENTIVTMGLGNDNDDPCAFGYGIGELNIDGTITVLDEGNDYYKTYELNKGSFFSSVSFDFSSYDLSEGKHTLVPISLLNGETEWKRCKPGDIYFDVSVSGGEKTIIAHPVENLTINSIELATGGMPGYSQGVNVNITNNGDNLEKTLYLYVGTADDKGSYAGSKTFRIAAGNTRDFRFSISQLDAGNYTLRLLDSKGSDVVLAQKDITIALDLAATNFEIVGKKYSNKTLKVNATVENHAGDYTLPLYLFASTTTDKTFYYAAGSAIEGGNSEVVTFYFQPNQAGTWNLWLATDTQGNNVIGQTTVEISEQNPVQLSIGSAVQKLSDNTIKAENIVVKVNVTNTGEYAYDDVIEAKLFLLPPNSNYGNVVDTKKQDLQLAVGAATSFDFTFDDLEDGSTYFFYIYYYTTDGTRNIKYQASGGYPYVFKYTPDSGEIIPGDANGDGEVNVSDIVEIVNDIMGKTSAKFVRDAADLNNDGEINVTDIVKVVSIIMSAGNGARVKTPLLENTDNDVLALTCNNDKTLSLGLRNAGGYVASQFDVRLSGGATLEGMILNNGRSDSHLLTYSEIDDNLYRVVIYSPENHSFVGNEGELLKIKTSGIGDVEIENILFITESQAEKRFSPLHDGTTGIQTIERSDAVDVYSLDGRLIRKQTKNIEGLNKGIYIINNKKLIVK